MSQVNLLLILKYAIAYTKNCPTLLQQLVPFAVSIARNSTLHNFVTVDLQTKMWAGYYTYSSCQKKEFLKKKDTC